MSAERGWRAIGKKNPARQPGIISKWGGIATRLILALDVSIVQMVGVENPARWPGLGGYLRLVNIMMSAIFSLIVLASEKVKLPYSLVTPQLCMAS